VATEPAAAGSATIFAPPDQPYAAIVGSLRTMPGSRILTARAMPGAIGILTGAGCAADAPQPIPHNAVPQMRYDVKLNGPGVDAIFIGPQMLLPSDQAWHVVRGCDRGRRYRARRSHGATEGALGNRSFIVNDLELTFNNRGILTFSS
jgi:hypothetical protein